MDPDAEVSLQSHCREDQNFSPKTFWNWTCYELIVSAWQCFLPAEQSDVLLLIINSYVKACLGFHLIPLAYRRGRQKIHNFELHVTLKSM
jgi:hypothetical protein